eukprot:2454496-Amphidinium_carterae.1
MAATLRALEELGIRAGPIAEDIQVLVAVGAKNASDTCRWQIHASIDVAYISIPVRVAIP